MFGSSHKTLFTENLLREEIIMWEAKWKKDKDETILSLLIALDVINQCEKNMYPNIDDFLKVFVMLSVSLVRVERAFSALRRLKI